MPITWQYSVLIDYNPKIDSFSVFERFSFSFYLVSDRAFLFLFSFSFPKIFSLDFSFSLTNLPSISFSFSFSYENIAVTQNM